MENSVWKLKRHIVWVPRRIVKWSSIACQVKICRKWLKLWSNHTDCKPGRKELTWLQASALKICSWQGYDQRWGSSTAQNPEASRRQTSRSSATYRGELKEKVRHWRLASKLVNWSLTLCKNKELEGYSVGRETPHCIMQKELKMMNQKIPTGMTEKKERVFWSSFKP